MPQAAATEYRVISLGTDWHGSNPAEKQKDIAKMPEELRKLPDLQSLLNQLAAEGWRVVDVGSCGTGVSDVILHRSANG